MGRAVRPHDGGPDRIDLGAALMTITFKVPFTTTEVALFMPSGLFFYFLRKRTITIIRFLGVMMALYTPETAEEEATSSAADNDF